MNARKVAIVGGGVIGLSSALGAAHAGARVTVFDAEPGSGATFAAAGMLSPGAEFLGGFQPDYANAVRSMSLWPQFARDLSIEIHRCATHVVGWTHGDRQEIARYVDEAKRDNVPIRSGGTPSFTLSPRTSVFCSFDEEGFVDADHVVSGLLRECAAVGVVFERQEVLEVSQVGDGVRIGLPGGPQRFDAAIVATGAKSELWPDEIRGQVQPVRGVTVRVALTPGDPSMLRGIVDGRQVYLVRRPNGVTVIGASAEFTSSTYIASRDVRDLLELASQLVPDVLDSTFIEARAGLRPLSRNGISIFHSSSNNIAWTTGYFRHGILMAPLAAQRARDFVDDAD